MAARTDDDRTDRAEILAVGVVDRNGKGQNGGVELTRVQPG